MASIVTALNYGVRVCCMLARSAVRRCSPFDLIIIFYWHTPQATRAQACGSSMTASTVTGSP